MKQEEHVSKQSNNAIKRALKLITLEFLFLKQSNRKYNAE